MKLSSLVLAQLPPQQTPESAPPNEALSLEEKAALLSEAEQIDYCNALRARILAAHAAGDDAHALISDEELALAIYIKGKNLTAAGTSVMKVAKEKKPKKETKAEIAKKTVDSLLLDL